MTHRWLAMIGLLVATRAAVPMPRWKLIVRTPGIALWVDSARIDSTRADKKVGLWLRFDYPQAMPVPEDTTKLFNQLLVNLAIDCHAETVHSITMEFVAPSGRSIETVPVPASQVDATFATHPFGQGTFVGLCGWLHAPDRFQPVVTGS